MTVVLARSLVLPDPDDDMALLQDALEAADVPVFWRSWDDPAASWSDADLVVIRTTWGYADDLPGFLAWAERVSATTRLENPFEIVRANVRKRYLESLSAQGLPVVPTRFVAKTASSKAPSLTAIMDESSWQEVVIKPEVSGASANTHRVHRDDVDEALFARLRRGHDMMVQPFLESVQTEPGERAIVSIAGEITHAVRKSPRFAGDPEETSPALEPSADERDLAQRAFATTGRELLYGRVDVARDSMGRPMIMELELIEPSLFLRKSPKALDRLVGAIKAADGRAHLRQNDG